MTEQYASTTTRFPRKSFVLCLVATVFTNDCELRGLQKFQFIVFGTFSFKRDGILLLLRYLWDQMAAVFFMFLKNITWILFFYYYSYFLQNTQVYTPVCMIRTLCGIATGSVLYEHVVERLVGSVGQLVDPHCGDPFLAHGALWVPAIDHTVITWPNGRHKTRWTSPILKLISYFYVYI